jgi:hypothetical protein
VPRQDFNESDRINGAQDGVVRAGISRRSTGDFTEHLKRGRGQCGFAVSVEELRGPHKNRKIVDGHFNSFA